MFFHQDVSSLLQILTSGDCLRQKHNFLAVIICIMKDFQVGLKPFCCFSYIYINIIYIICVYIFKKHFIVINLTDDKLFKNREMFPSLLMLWKVHEKAFCKSNIVFPGLHYNHIRCSIYVERKGDNRITRYWPVCLDLKILLIQTCYQLLFSLVLLILLCI